MIIVDTMNFHQACVHQNEIDSTPDDFFNYLAEEMIDNTLDNRGLRQDVRTHNGIRLRQDCSPHLSPCREYKGGKKWRYDKLHKTRIL